MKYAVKVNYYIDGVWAFELYITEEEETGGEEPYFFIEEDAKVISENVEIKAKEGVSWDVELVPEEV